MEENDEWTTFIKRKNKKNVINMKNDTVDFSEDFIGRSGSGAEIHVPSLGHHSQRKFPTASLIPEESVIFLSNLQDVEVSLKPTQEVIVGREVGYVPGYKIPIDSRESIAQKMEEGFATGNPRKILEAFHYHNIRDIEEVTVAPKEFASKIHEEFGEVVQSMIKSTEEGKIKKYTIPTAVMIATQFDKFALQECIAVAHKANKPELAAAFMGLYRAKIENIPQVEKARLKLVKA